jgi:hypothetical protein
MESNQWKEEERIVLFVPFFQEKQETIGGIPFGPKNLNSLCGTTFGHTMNLIFYTTLLGKKKKQENHMGTMVWG